jgi:hypothetical protein
MSYVQQINTPDMKQFCVEADTNSSTALQVTKGGEQKRSAWGHNWAILSLVGKSRDLVLQAGDCT